MVEQISDAEALFLYKTILQEVNAKSSLSYLKDSEKDDKSSKASLKGQTPPVIFSDVFSQSNRK